MSEWWENNSEWIEVNGHPDYVISMFGYIRRKKDQHDVRMTSNGDRGYRVCLDGKQYYIHRLVMEHFGKLKEGRNVKHYDGDLHNNMIYNLGYSSKQRRRIVNETAKIVRCKYCRFRDTNGFCRSRRDDFYCANGELRDDI